MNVQELIDALNKIEDKSKKVIASRDSGEVMEPTEYTKYILLKDTDED